MSDNVFYQMYELLDMEDAVITTNWPIPSDYKVQVNDVLIIQDNKYTVEAVHRTKFIIWLVPAKETQNNE